MPLVNHCWLACLAGFLLPSLLLVTGSVTGFVNPKLNISGWYLYVAICLAAVICALSILTAPMKLWSRVGLLLVVWTLLAVQILILGVITMMTGGLEGTQ